jgi:hypothetical protein
MHQLRPKVRCHRGTANTRPCEPPAPHDPLGIAAGEALPDVSRCLAFMSLFEVARAAFSAPHAHGFSTTGANRWKSPTSESPGATHTPSCLGSSAATSRTPEVVLAGGGRCALRRVPNVASIKKRIRNSHTSFAPTFSCSALGSVKSSECSGRR